MCVNNVAVELNLTYAHLHDKLIPKLVDLGIAMTEKKGRCRYVRLTAKGKYIFKLIEEMGITINAQSFTTFNNRMDDLYNAEIK
jgi:predicted transcriptional regulator